MDDGSKHGSKPEIFIITFVDDKGNTHKLPVPSTSVECFKNLLVKIGCEIQNISGKSSFWDYCMSLQSDIMELKESENGENAGN